MRKNKKDIRTIIENGLPLIMNKDAYDYIMRLKNCLAAVEAENKNLKTELDIIKPVLSVEGVKPAVHTSCGECRFVIRSRWNNEIIGCCKDCVCDDFYPREE